MLTPAQLPDQWPPAELMCEPCRQSERANQLRAEGRVAEADGVLAEWVAWSGVLGALVQPCDCPPCPACSTGQPCPYGHG